MPPERETFLLAGFASPLDWPEQSEESSGSRAQHYLDLIATVVGSNGGVGMVGYGEQVQNAAVFGDACEAAAAAIEIQLAIAGEIRSEPHPVHVRIGLHSGVAQSRGRANKPGANDPRETILRGGRLRDAAHGGQILLSDAWREAAGDRLPDGATLSSLGVHRLKDLGRPERIWQLCHPGLTCEFPALRSLDAIPNNLPAQATTLVGRERELGTLAELVCANRVLTLTGAGGVGKSRLAAHLAAEAIEHHKDGSWWVDLGAVSTGEMVSPSIAATFGLRGEPGRSPVDALVENLQAREALVVLDNCEQVLDAVAGVVEALTAGAPGLTLVATSREPLGVSGEMVWRVPSLDRSCATRLFIERAGLVRPGFDPDAPTTGVIGDICDRLDGLPLAIELAAARARMMHPNRIAAALDDRFRLLTGGLRTALSRQQTLEASVAWSFDLLAEREFVVLRRLSVFAGGFTLDAAEAVAADGEVIETYDVLGLLTQLVDKSLVQVDSDADGRYRLLETVRQYAQIRLVESAESAEVRDRHLGHFVDLVETGASEFAGDDGSSWLERIEQDHDNVRAAFEWADTSRRGSECLRIVSGMAIFWELRGHLAAGGKWFERALSHTEAPGALRARALWGAAHVALYSDDIPVAMDRAPEALALAESVGDTRAAVRARNTIGFGRLWFDPSGARLFLDANIGEARAQGDAWAVGDGLKMVSISWMIQDDWPSARDSLDLLKRHAAPIGNRFWLAWCHYGAGYGALHQGDVATAQVELESARNLCDEIGDPATRGLCIAALGELDSITGRYEEARTRLETFMQGGFAAGSDWGLPFAALSLASLYLGTGDLRLALELTDRSADEIELPVLSSWALSLRAAALVASGDLDAAVSVLEEARPRADATGNPMVLSLVDQEMARTAAARGRLSDAEDIAQRALATRCGAGLIPGVIDSLEFLAGLAGRQASHTEAVRLLAAASHERGVRSLIRFPVAAREADLTLASAVEALGSPTVESAWSEGEALSVAEAVAYVARARGERKRPPTGWESLTPTELDVVGYVAQGLTNPQIGEKLFIARTTVKTHMAHVFVKLGVTTRAELAALATRRSTT